ncbi:putative membrane protein [Clostridioides difficile DA00246]|nr:putative membrane protein [Clostridioides difficile DA00246]
MDKLLAVVQYILNMGPTVILPITIVVLGMILELSLQKL